MGFVIVGRGVTKIYKVWKINSMNLLVKLHADIPIQQKKTRGGCHTARWTVAVEVQLYNR